MRFAPALLAIVLVAGCGLLPSDPPDWVTDRPGLPACGVEEAGHGEFDIAKRTCLLDAFEAGRGAELISTLVTIEGDPITQYIRVHPDATVEIFVDATRDAFGSGTWERLICRRLSSVAEANAPPDLVFPAAMVFVEDGCEPVET
jgi:hypothetical protein